MIYLMLKMIKEIGAYFLELAFSGIWGIRDFNGVLVLFLKNERTDCAVNDDVFFLQSGKELLPFGAQICFGEMIAWQILLLRGFGYFFLFFGLLLYRRDAQLRRNFLCGNGWCCFQYCRFFFLGKFGLHRGFGFWFGCLGNRRCTFKKRR